MAVITFMSDFGTDDHYVAAVKAAIVSKTVNQPIADISHMIKPYDISHAANVLKHVYKEFPKGSVHLVAVDAMKKKSNPIAIELDGHFFVGFDSGIFSLISNNKPNQMVIIDCEECTFPAKNVLAKAALSLIKGVRLESLGTKIEQIYELYGRQLKVTKREIVGNVVHVDSYGNLITNIIKTEFDKMMELNGDGTRFSIQVGRQVFNELQSYFTDVESGDCYILFNSSEYLQIGILRGDASSLLGLRVDSPIHIEFSTQ
ncbi:MAG: S-adenosyl-l-methionine hydroxide adenosyltransferase family protein [Ekhidna sp.]